MCAICGKEENKFYMSGLSEKICTDCHSAILKARSGDIVSATNYFNEITFKNEQAVSYVQNELSSQNVKKPEYKLSLPNDTDSDSQCDPSTLENDQKITMSDVASKNTLSKMENDIKTIKNILIFFFAMFLIGAGATLIYIIQLSNSLKSIF